MLADIVDFPITGWSFKTSFIIKTSSKKVFGREGREQEDIFNDINKLDFNFEKLFCYFLLFYYKCHKLIQATQVESNNKKLLDTPVSVPR